MAPTKQKRSAKPAKLMIPTAAEKEPSVPPLVEKGRPDSISSSSSSELDSVNTSSRTSSEEEARTSSANPRTPKLPGFPVAVPNQPRWSFTEAQSGSFAGADRTTISDTDFLTALAAQERFVLEIKEELREAEENLQKLKKQWAYHEATKKRGESRRLQQLQPVRPATTSKSSALHRDDQDGSEAWMYEEMERRKKLIGHARTSSRRVFSGSRHTRTLSLLGSENSRPSAALSAEGLDNRAPSFSGHRTSRPSRSSTTSDVPLGHDEILNRNSQHEAILRASRQVATDLKDGLWTLIEDLKHATVGDEPRSGNSDSAATRSSGDRNETPRPARPTIGGNTNQDPSSARRHTLMDFNNLFWRENGVVEDDANGKSKIAPKTPQKQLHSRVVDGESWDTWSSPVHEVSPSKSSVLESPLRSPYSSTAMDEDSPDTTRSDYMDSKQRASTEARDSRDAIPWPALTKLARPAGQFRRTASHLMSEWEKSLSPPPEPEDEAVLQ